jgi:hypothetical protein
VLITSGVAGAIDIILDVAGINVSRYGYNGSNGAGTVGAIVPNGIAYQLTVSAGSIAVWAELR